MTKSDELRRRLAILAERWGLPAEGASQLERLLNLLAGEDHAPTAVVDPLMALDQHVADSLSALEMAELRALSKIVDIGSGAGFPGLALAVALPQSRLDLLESSGRKCRFLERMVGAAALGNVRIVCARAEEWATGEGAQVYQGVTARAVGPLATLVEYAAPLLEIGGMLVAWKGRRDPDEEERGGAAAVLLGMQPLRVASVEPFPGARARHIHLYRKVGALPDGFPRRPGMARKRPLGTSRPSR